MVPYAPVLPWQRRFRWGQVFFRDHRKILVVDGEIGFVGGINLASPWLSREEGGLAWRDDAVEVRGPLTAHLRGVFATMWERCRGQALAGAFAPPPTTKEIETPQRVVVLTNRIGSRPNRRIRREYLRAIRRAKTSIDIASAYFLPGPLFLRALRSARRRGVRVRVLVPKVADVWLVSLAVTHLVGRLLEEGVEVYTYGRSMLHFEGHAVIDRRLVIVGSHNLDTLSWRYNLECNVTIDDSAFAEGFVESFERDLDGAERPTPARLACAPLDRPRARQARLQGADVSLTGGAQALVA